MFHSSLLLSPVEPFNEASTPSLFALAISQILYSTGPVLASGLDLEISFPQLLRFGINNVLKILSKRIT